mmetsp:Transcript_8821/g.36996  ORF Transcript_8821/g.36996 Transcript_8821/m.36996 type:complete len:231 (-) Transcript_8821:2137-2829(-)
MRLSFPAFLRRTHRAPTRARSRARGATTRSRTARRSTCGSSRGAGPPASARRGGNARARRRSAPPTPWSRRSRCTDCGRPSRRPSRARPEVPKSQRLRRRRGARAALLASSGVKSPRGAPTAPSRLRRASGRRTAACPRGCAPSRSRRPGVTTRRFCRRARRTDGWRPRGSPTRSARTSGRSTGRALRGRIAPGKSRGLTRKRTTERRSTSPGAREHPTRSSTPPAPPSL